MAFYLMSKSDKGISSHQMARELDITQKTAWFLCRRIREAMKMQPIKQETADLPAPIKRGNSTSAIQAKFTRLATEWKSTRGHSSKMVDLVVHPSYQQIIGMGREAIPLLLVEMSDQPDHWDWALRAITGVDPVPQTSWGKLQDISEAWLAWGRSEGYVK
jgi:hypothetical protein